MYKSPISHPRGTCAREPWWSQLTEREDWSRPCSSWCSSHQPLDQNQKHKNHYINLNTSSFFIWPVSRFPFLFLEQHPFLSVGQGRTDPYQTKAFLKQCRNFKSKSAQLSTHQESREEWEANKWHAPQVSEYLNYISQKKPQYITASYWKWVTPFNEPCFHRAD